MITFRIERSYTSNGYNVWVVDHRKDRSYIWKPIKIENEVIEDGQRLPEPTFIIPEFEAQELIPALRKALLGLSWYDKEEYDTNKLVQKALEDHIASLRNVVEKILK